MSRYHICIYNVKKEEHTFDIDSLNGFWFGLTYRLSRLPRNVLNNLDPEFLLCVAEVRCQALDELRMNETAAFQPWKNLGS